ncbi:MAG: winged helix-turn-helix domain-containing protein [Candidatus Omnitrophica bacterium]|nr:winged helix-turn-helix domain-containing protein [Candidatus Omnitrophota bacterium]
MITEIGIVAGDIWHQLDQKGKLSVNDLVQNTGRDRNLILMGLGWLAREGHVFIEGDIGTGVASLTRK